MAKMKKGIFGPVSGKLGPLIAGIWKGIPFIKMVPNKKGKKKSTPAQIAARKKLAFVNELLVPFHPYITVGFMHEAEHRTEISAAFSKNYYVVKGSYPNFTVAYEEFVVSVGALPQLKDVTLTLQDENTISLTWETNSVKYTSFDDQLMLVVYCPELNITDGFVGGPKRRDKQCSFKFDQRMVGKRLEVYLGITSIDRKRIANSVYLGGLNV
jgi:hypothetical protein